MTARTRLMMLPLLLAIAGWMLGGRVVGPAFLSVRLAAAAEESYDTQVETPLVGDYTNFAGLSPILLEGVGLVVGLPGTGGNPAPSMYRTALLEDMKKRAIRNPNVILQSPNTALVVVRAYLPPLMSPGDQLDVEIVLPDSAEAKSIAGGWLMETELHEQAFVPGRGVLKGHPFARAKGPVLVAGVGRQHKDDDPLLKRGRVLGGARVLKERELAIYLRNDFRSVRNSSRIAEAIGRRFHHFDKFGSQKPMAEAKTDQKIVLTVHPRYKDNYPRYLQVVRSIAFRETNVSQRVRLQRLHDELMTPESSDTAALKLEAIGREAIPTLKAALKSPLLEVRFHAAMALAYLEEPEALPALAEAARTERAFRVFAFAAMSTVDDAQAHLELRELMSDDIPETRYGAFRALWTLDKNDPFIRAVPMGMKEVLPGEEVKPQEPMWHLHVLQTRGQPMTHCTLRTRPEVVLFGADQELIPPLVLSAGRHVMLTAQPGSKTVSITRFAPNQPDVRKEVSLKLADVLLTVDELGATYPDVVNMLAQASEQRNLPATLETDALPESGRIYARPASPNGPAKRTKVGREHLSPNMFPRFEEAEKQRQETIQQASFEVEATDAAAAGKEEPGKPRRLVDRLWPWSKDE